MKKGIFWTGLVGLILGLLLLFLSGSRSGPNLEPTIPLLYETNQSIWMLLGFAGLIVMVIGLVLKTKK